MTSRHENGAAAAIGKFDLKSFLLRHNAILILIVLVAVSAALSPVFMTRQNIFNILRQNTPIFLVSLGMLMVILTGGIDLSVGSVAAVGGMLFTVALVQWQWSSGLGLAACLLLSVALGSLFGLASGVMVSYAGMAPFVVTLAMMTIARGCAYLVTNGQPIRWPSRTPGTQIMLDFGSKNFLGLPWPVLVGALAFAVFLIIMRYNTFGRLVIAVGSNQTAVSLAGIDAKFYKCAVYVISAFMSTLAGIVMSCRTGVGTPITGEGYELDAIAACVIGGASLAGGKGKVGSTLIGVLILALITNIMNLLSVPAYPQKIVKGLIIIASVFVQSVSDKRRDV